MISASEIVAAFDGAGELTVGVEEELMLLDPETWDLVPRARPIVEALGSDPRFKLEMPASQIEIVTPPRASIAELGVDLHGARRDLRAASATVAELAGSGTHPFAQPEGALNRGQRYRGIADRFGRIANRQLVFALQIHVSPGSADDALAAYNGLRSYLPVIAAVAANAPFHADADSGLASVRPLIAQQLPRQGVPPPIASWDQHAAELAWGTQAGVVPSPGAWWWELRPHVGFGTLELRVPDTQTTVGEALAVAAFVHCLVASLVQRHRGGESIAVHPGWRIAENRWMAARDGVDARFVDLDDGREVCLRDRLGSLLDELTPIAVSLGCDRELERVRPMLSANGATRQREIARERGRHGLVAWLSESFLDPP